MRLVQTEEQFSLASVKPLEGLLSYRDYCLRATKEALKGSRRRRERSLVSDAALEPFGAVGGLAYGRCPSTGSVFLTELPQPEAWARLLAQVSRFRRSPEAFHLELAQSRTDNVYAPKLEWMEQTLRLHQVRRPRLLEVVTPPSQFTSLLQESRLYEQVLTLDEMALAHGGATAPGERAQAAILLESLDRVDEPEALLRGVIDRMDDGGLVFVTALAASGFDIAVLGTRNLYLYPPDRANCFSRQGLLALLDRVGLTPMEVSTPGVLDVQIVRAHLARDPSLPLSTFERQLINEHEDTHAALQAFLQQRGLSSFTRIVARKGSG